MKSTQNIIGALLVMIIFSGELFAQNSDFTRIGNIDGEVFIDKYDDYYLLTYQNINMDSKDETFSFQIHDKAAISKIYKEVRNSFTGKNENPTTVQLEDVELRIYFKERFLRADYVEIIHENLQTETTGTLPWLTLEEIEKLFGNKK